MTELRSGGAITGGGGGAAEIPGAPQIPPPEENGDPQSAVEGLTAPVEVDEIEARGGGTTISSSSWSAEDPKIREGGDEGERPMILPIGVTRGLVSRLEDPRAEDVGGGAIGEGL
jgi:hypothetical protein